MALSTLGQRQTGRRPWDAWFAFKTLVLLTLTCWISASDAATLPAQSLQRRAQIGGGVDLRVLPIGDSITFGAKSSKEDGYRKSLYNKLAARGNNVDFVGFVTSGTGVDNDHEGHRGFLIDGISGASDVGIYAAPNIALLHAGTNDMYHDSDVGNAPTRLKNLINKIFDHSSDAVVLVCQIIPSTTASYQTRINNFNAKIPDLVSSFVEAGKKVMMVSMNEVVSTSDLADNLHPNDGGYEKMADAYYAAIEAADSKDWISKPGKAQTAPDSTSPDKCQATPSWYYTGQIADGAKVATTDGDFKSSWVKRGVIAEGACPRAQLHFMDLDGDGLKDYACVDPDTGAVNVHLNIPDSDGKSSGKWNNLGKIATGKKGRDGYGVLFADLNGDGRDDYIYVDPDDGEVYAWINQLETDGVWQWQSLGRIAGGIGATNETVQMVDVDGDGRDDFCLVNQKTGEVTAWLNTGADIMPDYYKLGIIATGSSVSKGDTVRLGDLTGEGRADYMIVGSGGKVNALINRLQETTLVPRWLEAFTFAEGPDGAEQEEVRLVDMTGDGKLDYVLVEKKTGKVTLWENLGTGGKYQPGEGVVLCDLDGDGTSDYFWLDHNGRGWGYLNVGKGTNAWNNLGQIANGPVRDRSLLRMGVLTHSKRADYIMVEEDTGRALWWQNLGPDSGWGWASRGEAAAGPWKTIENTYGWKFRGRNVRFADLDGDGFDDYLYVNDQGAVVMWKNLGTNPISWGLPHLVADGVGVLARQVQFADTDGDGLLDYVVVGSVTGRSRSWHNLGFRDDGSIRWNTPLSFADGTGPGFAIRITEMTGDKRADYVSIDPDNGRINLWHNRCWPIDQPVPGDGGDDGGSDDGGHDGGNEDDDYDAEKLEVCDQSYKSLDDIVDDADKIPDHCVALYILPILKGIATKALDQYNDILDDGYDKKFDIYAEAVAKQAGGSVRQFISDHGDDHLNCKIVEAVSCKRICEYKDGDGAKKCQWSTIEQCDEISGPYVGSGYGPLEYINTTQSCPPDMSKRGIGDRDEQTIYWSLSKDKADKFYIALLDGTGIGEEDIDWNDNHAPEYTPDKTCDPAFVDKVPEECYYKGWWFNEPNAWGYKTSDVTDPKDVVSKALSKLKGIDVEIDIAITRIKLVQWEKPNELVDALSIPILMVQQAVKAMEKVKETAEAIIEAERKETIALFLGAIFFIVPLAGEALAAAGLATLGRYIALIGESAGVGQGIYEIANDPDSLPLAIFDLVLGGAGIRDAAKVGKAAKYRNEFRPKDGMLGDAVKGDLDKISKVNKDLCSK
ncbi:hypothetical protein E0Z10_g1365 [Xylaria hypoxylon]|uniref:SGNH hydrolase-type esterase domain-containing protein n=1 Tax=Xylaria hypoxylon TaxID=37992 RepID=A0A4Z0Z6S2_9PEZI|nr:hypothetical protein E0Z10_g1365 [Xylaria hypoxylon]